MDFNFIENNNKFGTVSNRIAYYYKEVFDIEIVSLLYKNKDKTDIQDRLHAKNYLDKLRGIDFNFYILIKDNNRIWKYKLIKCKLNCSNYIDNNDTFDFSEALYYIVDQKVCEYCKKYKFKRMKKKDFEEILLKDREINDDYNSWVMGNFEVNKNNTEQK